MVCHICRSSGARCKDCKIHQLEYKIDSLQTQTTNLSIRLRELEKIIKKTGLGNTAKFIAQMDGS